MTEKNLEKFNQSKETSTEHPKWITKCTEDRRQYLKTLLEEKTRKGLTTAEKLAKIQSFVEKWLVWRSMMEWL